MAHINVTFPGGARVDANINGRDILTDQPVSGGGNDSAASPFELFLASLATCSGIFALSFCQNKNISTEGLGLTMDAGKNPETNAFEKVSFKLTLPTNFPVKYKGAIVKAMNLCSVKKFMMNMPEFEIVTEE